mmetsp:Transcript_28317/g.71108  ORF Transcript_28317/g.71108 Transcript_28317/m.71108 type:complete len:304 (+) Transcript_28317:779-1690(+)
MVRTRVVHSPLGDALHAGVTAVACEARGPGRRGGRSAPAPRRRRGSRGRGHACRGLATATAAARRGRGRQPRRPGRGGQQQQRGRRPRRILEVFGGRCRLVHVPAAERRERHHDVHHEDLPGGERAESGVGRHGQYGAAGRADGGGVRAGRASGEAAPAAGGQRFHESRALSVVVLLRGAVPPHLGSIMACVVGPVYLHRELLPRHGPHPLAHPRRGFPHRGARYRQFIGNGGELVDIVRGDPRLLASAGHDHAAGRLLDVRHHLLRLCRVRAVLGARDQGQIRRRGSLRALEARQARQRPVP